MHRMTFITVTRRRRAHDPTRRNRAWMRRRARAEAARTVNHAAPRKPDAPPAMSE